MYKPIDNNPAVNIDEYGRLVNERMRPITPTADANGYLTFPLPQRTGDPQTRFVHVEVVRHHGDVFARNTNPGEIAADQVLFVDGSKANTNVGNLVYLRPTLVIGRTIEEEDELSRLDVGTLVHVDNSSSTEITVPVGVFKKGDSVMLHQVDQPIDMVVEKVADAVFDDGSAALGAATDEVGEVTVALGTRVYVADSSTAGQIGKVYIAADGGPGEWVWEEGNPYQAISAANSSTGTGSIIQLICLDDTPNGEVFLVKNGENR